MLISSYEKNYGDNPEIVGDSGEQVDIPDSGLTFVVMLIIVVVVLI